MRTSFAVRNAGGPDDNVPTSMRSIVVDTTSYDWEVDKPLNRPMLDTVVYELHVGGYTKSPTSGVSHPGTFSSIIEKIPYLRDLGITAVELLPVLDFDEKEVTRISPVDGKPLTDFWGYSTHSFFAPGLSSCRTSWRTQRSLPRCGMRRERTRLVTSRAIAGVNGTGVTGTISGAL